MSDLIALAERCEKAAAAVARVEAMSERGPVSASAVAIASGMILVLHGPLFAEVATELRARAAGEPK